MDGIGAKVVTPTLPPGVTASEEPLLGLKSGYLLRSLHLMPSQGPARPWRLDHDYLLDRDEMRNLPIDDGNLTFTNAQPVARADEMLEAAE